MSTLDYSDDLFWQSIESAEIEVLERLAAEVKDDLGRLEEERILRRAEFDEYTTEVHHPRDFTRARAAHSRWRAEAFVQHRQMTRRQTQLKDAMQHQVGSDAGWKAQKLIHRLTTAILEHQTDDSTSDEELYSVLDRSFVVVRGQQLTLREFHAAGSKW